ncbi:toxin-antitoxin system HicB family antitoxin [Siccibacter colletis]|nr:toxin-antitoxin system HicB family antitoxin [Siccibacter colletis]WNN48692.1 toxin-antitoxin system HicB family antitoxin [Siccibacter colletis]
MSMIKRDKKSTIGGPAPQFKMRIDPALREQLDAEAAAQGISLANWFKNLAREALKKKGIEPKG